MAGGNFQISLIFLLYVFGLLTGFIHSSDDTPRLEILPHQTKHERPVGKTMMLTCRPIVRDSNLITDLQWRDNMNMTIPPKTSEYSPMYDSKGFEISTPSGQTQLGMYTELLPVDQSLALIIPSLKESMAGKYYCSAMYANSQLLEVNTTIETYVAITWKNAPENQFPTLGSDFMVRCEVTASPSPSIDWLKEGDPIKNSAKYVVETDGLLIKNAQESDEGIYTCRAAVIQTGELVERNIRIEVYIKPEIKSLAESLEATEGQDFATICNASGKPVPEIQWIKSQTQQNVATLDRFLVNAQNGLMAISKVHRDDYGTYVCVAKNNAGEARAETKLNVIVPPKIEDLKNVTGVLNEEISIKCLASGRPAPEITFRRWGSDDVFIAKKEEDNGRILLEQYTDNNKGESLGKLKITKLQRSDDGLYECIARNKADEKRGVGHITVEFPPDFSYMKKLPPVFSWEERPANLSCIAESIPNATIEWRWNGKPVKDLYDKNLRIDGSGPRSDLIVKPVERRYYSTYKCIARNKHGTEEFDMQLKEGTLPGPLISAKPLDVKATTISFDILGPPIESGLPILAYSVRYRQDFNPDWSLAQKRDWSPGSPYIIEGLKPQTLYHFQFSARNQVGQGLWSANVAQSTSKRSAPEEPKMLLYNSAQDDNGEKIVISPYSDHFELKWDLPADNGEPIDFYQVKYCPGLKINGKWNELGNECITQNITETYFEMINLNPSTYYRIELAAHNALGFSKTGSITMKTVQGNDVILRVEKTSLSSAAIVTMAIGAVLAIFLIVDLMCCLKAKVGFFAFVCRRGKRSTCDIKEERKLKADEEPLNTPMNVLKRNLSVEFDGRAVHNSRGNITGKYSAV